jgi:outer membrane protein assembly factor BamB
VLFVGRDRLVAIDRALSALRWQRKAQERWSSRVPLLHRDGTVVVAGTRGEVVAYSLADGREQWRRTLKGKVRSVGYADGCFYAGTQEGPLYAWRAEE